MCSLIREIAWLSILQWAHARGCFDHSIGQSNTFYCQMKQGCFMKQRFMDQQKLIENKNKEFPEEQIFCLS